MNEAGKGQNIPRIHPGQTLAPTEVGNPFYLTGSHSFRCRFI